MKYVQPKEDEQNQFALVAKQREFTRAVVLSALIVSGAALIINELTPVASLDPRGVLIGVIASVCNVYLWRLIVRSLLMTSNRKRSSAGSSGVTTLFIFKLSFLTAVLIIMAGYVPELIVPALFGAVAFIFLSTLLIPFVSYNKG